MIKRLVSLAIAGAIIIGGIGCKSNSGFKIKDGIEYMLVKDKEGKTADSGDLIKMHVRVHNTAYDKSGKTLSDSILFDTKKMNNNEPVEFPLRFSNQPGDWMPGLTMLSVGDSAVFRVSVDTLKKSLPPGQQMPPFMKPGSFMVYEVTIVAIKGKAAYQKDMEGKRNEEQAKQMQQVKSDEDILSNYFAKNHINAMKTPLGVYYTIQKEGSGELPKMGDMIHVNYTGKTLDGKTFDSNTDPKFSHGEKGPLKFPIGRGAVIKGWDDGVSVLKKGSKAMLYIPSTLAYGEHSPSPLIPANSILMFEVEIVDIQSEPAANKKQ